MSDTPRTDAAIIERRHIHKICGCVELLELVDADVARKLERECNNLQDQRDFCMGEIERLRKERDEARNIACSLDDYEAMEALLCEMQGLRDELVCAKRERDEAREALQSGGGYQEQCMKCGILFWGQRDAPFCKSCAEQAKEATK